MTINNKGNLFVFEVGPSVKFVSAIKDAIFKKKMGVIFLFGKMPNWGGGPRGVWQKTTFFPGFFCAPFPYLCFWSRRRFVQMLSPMNSPRPILLRILNNQKFRGH